MLQIMRMSIMNIVPHKTPNIISQGVINYFNTRKLFFHKKIGSIHYKIIQKTNWANKLIIALKLPNVWCNWRYK